MDFLKKLLQIKWITYIMRPIEVTGFCRDQELGPNKEYQTIIILEKRSGYPNFLNGFLLFFRSPDNSEAPIFTLLILFFAPSTVIFSTLLKFIPKVG